MKQTINIIVVALIIVGAALLPISRASAADASKPNIVLILADNLGYGELGSYGGGITRGARVKCAISRRIALVTSK